MADDQHPAATAGADETTGHEWDGITELNNPLPRWWLWTFYLTILWSIGYVILMPAVPLPGGPTRGLLDYSQRQMVADQVAALRAAREARAADLVTADLDTIRARPDLLAFALAGGASAFAVNCSQCHGQGAAGAPGYPNLNDDDWLWGGSLAEIRDTIAFGVRSGHDSARENAMPGFVSEEILKPIEVERVTDYVLSLSGADHDPVRAAAGAEVFAENCADCHGADGRGDTSLGGPNLADAIWLYDGDRKTVAISIAAGRGGVMPAWEGRLNAATLKQLAIFVHARGGGQ